MQNKRINYTQVVWEITRLLQEAESLEDALRTSLGEVVKAVGAEAGTIWFYNAAGDQRIYPSFSIGGADLTGMSLAAGEGIAGTVVKEGRTTVVKDCQKDARWAGRFDAATGFVTRSMVCVPLINKYEVMGCIQIINKKDGSLYNGADVELCENLAILTAIAIDGKGLNLGFAEEKKAIISLGNVTKTFGTGDAQIQILKGVNLDVRGTGDAGLGSNEYYICLTEAAFDTDYYSGCYTAAYIDSSVLDGVYYFSDTYESCEAVYLARLEPLAQERAALRYESLQAEVDQELSDARQELADAEAEAADLQLENWVLSGRENVGDVRGLSIIVGTIRGLSVVMALLFLLVAVVICFSAITRVIREQRVQIGAQKALGFTTGEVFKHYTLYNLSCAVLGILLGWFLAVTIVETMSLGIFAPQFCIGEVPLAFTWSTALLSAVLCLAVFLIATFATCSKLVKEPAIDLLRGDVPTRGKRLFFENWGFYQKLNLYSRTMVKNVLNNKGRMATTVVGVMGCTALPVACFSMKLGIQNASKAHFDHCADYATGRW